MTQTLSNLRGSLERIWAQKDYFRNASTDIVATGFGFASGILVARGLGPEGRGQFAAAMMWPGLAGVLVVFGLQQAFAFAAGAGWSSPKNLHRMAALYSLIVGVAATFLFLLACPYLFRKSFPGTLWIPAAFAWSIPFALYSGFLMTIYQGRGDFKRWNGAKLLRSGGWTLAVGGFLVLGSATVFNFLLAQLLILVVLSVYLAWGIPALSSSLVEPPCSFGRLLRYGLAVYASHIVYMVNQQLDQLLLSLWVVPEQLGQYAAAVTVSGILLLVPGVIGPIIFSQMARLGPSVPRHGTSAAEGFWLTCALLAPAGVLLGFAGPWVVYLLYGAAFAEAGGLLRVLAPAAIFLGLGQVLSEILRGAGKPMLATYGIIAGAIVTVVGLAYALPRYGIWGAAWVSLVAYAMMAVGQLLLAWPYIRRRSQEAPVVL